MPEQLEYTIRPATPADISAMAGVLSRAFLDDDPFGGFLFPDPHKRSTRQVKMLAILIKRRFIPQGTAEVAVQGGRVVGVCLWHGPDHRRTPWHSFVAGPELTWAMRTRVFAGIAIDSTFAKISPGVRHLFGVYLGCDPDVQRAGIGQGLVKSFLNKADTEQVPVVGVCKDENVPYYNALGLSRFGLTRLGRRGPVANIMIKLPSPAAATVSPTRA